MTRRLVISVVCVAAFATADSALRYWRERSARTGRASAATSSAMRVLDAPLPLRSFAATDIDGRDVSPPTWHGKFGLVNFWATWCPPCRIEIPALTELQTRYQGTLQVIGVLQDQVSVDFVRAFAKSLSMNYPIVIARWEIESAFGEVLVLPTSYLVDPEGRVIATHIGPIAIEAMGELIEERSRLGRPR